MSAVTEGPATTEDDTQRYRAIFRLFIDYLESFPPQQRHAGMILWCHQGAARRGVNYTQLALRYVTEGCLQLGILPDDQHNEWEPGSVEACLQRFRSAFEVVDTVCARQVADDSRCGTAQVKLRHKVCSEYLVTLRFLKKVALACNNHVYLIDDDGNSIPVKKCKPIKLFNLPFVTNTSVMEPWVNHQVVKRRKRKTYTEEEQQQRKAQRKRGTKRVTRTDDHVCDLLARETEHE